jgi:hypothetical protein
MPYTNPCWSITLVKFSFIARCGEDSMLLEVNLDYQPGKQNQRARRLAVGYLLAKLGAESANVDATGADRVIVTTEKETWVIGEAGATGSKRGRL